MNMQNGLSQNWTALNLQTEDKYKIITVQSDSFLYIILDKHDLHSLRRYITDLEYRSKYANLSELENSVLINKVSLLNSEKFNLEKQINLYESSIKANKVLQQQIEDKYKKDKKKKWKQGFNTGVVTGVVAILTGAWLLNR